MSDALPAGLLEDVRDRLAVTTRRTSARPDAVNAPRSARSSRVRPARCGTRSETSVPGRATGASTAWQRVPSARRTSAHGLASSSRRPPAATSRWASARTASSSRNRTLARSSPRPRSNHTSSGPLTASGLALVRRVVTARLAFLVSGGTGSGKTTLLAAMLGEADPENRLVLVEDASELRPRHPHVVGLEARPANIEGAGAIVLRDLVRQALRMRPDRLVVGEVRGAEVADLLAALNTGHEGGCGTVHANAASDVPARVEALALGAGLGREAAHSQFASAIEAVLHLTRDRSGKRRLSEVAVPVRERSGLVAMVPAVTFAADGRSVEGPGAARLADRFGCDEVPDRGDEGGGGACPC